MIKGLIFDLDGVIVNTEKNHFLAWKQIASELGIFFSEKENELLKGISRRDSLNVILKGSLSIIFSEPADIFVSTCGGLWSIKLIGPEFSVTGNGTPEILNKLPLLISNWSSNLF